MTDEEILADEKTIARLVAAARIIAAHLRDGAADLHVDDLRCLLLDALTLVDGLNAEYVLGDHHADTVERLSRLAGRIEANR